MISIERCRWIAGSALMLILASAGCIDGFSVPNPRNCVTSATPCAEGFSCNLNTQRCEPRSPSQPLAANCLEQPASCGPRELCDGEQLRCVPRRFVIGQPDEKTNLNISYGLHQPYVAKLFRDRGDSGKTKLAVAEWGHQRVLIWNQIPTMNRPADVVLGQQDLMTTTYGRIYNPANLGILYTPWSLASNGSNLIIAERNYHRLTIWSALPVQSGIDRLLAPTGFWGQLSYVSPKPNAGLPAVSSLGVQNPMVFAEDRPDGAVFVADSGNHRVLVFDGMPADAMTAPRWVIGQPDFTSSSIRPPELGLGNPLGLFSDGTQLFVADEAWNRVLVYELPITRNDPTPVMVLGQPDLSSIAGNHGGPPSANTLYAPYDVALTNLGGVRQLYVLDSRNHRVLRYTLPNTTADLVVGHKTFVSSIQDDNGPTGNVGLNSPRSIATDGVHLVVAELGNRRVQIWNKLPMQNGQPSDVVLGQPDALTREANRPPVVHALQLQRPASVSSDGRRLFVADSGNHRVLIWNRIPKDGATLPDFVLGQRDFTSHFANPDGVTASSLANPTDVRSDGNRLAVVDSDNHRVLIWNLVPQQNFAPADVVLGQPDMKTNTAGTSAQKFDSPLAVLFYADVLLVSDQMNNRVLRFDAPYTSGATATHVLGQPDMNSKQVFGGLPASGRGFSRPAFLTNDGARIVIVDNQASRVLVWNNLPTTALQPADVVIGSATFNTYNPSGKLDQQLNLPSGVHVAGGRLLVSSSSSNRVLIWNRTPTENATSSSLVLGQTDLANELPNAGTLDPIERLSMPMGLTVADGRLFIADQENNRIVVRDL